MSLKERLALKLAEARKAFEAGDIEKGNELRSEAESLKAALDGLNVLEGIETETKSLLRPTLPGVGDGAHPDESATKGKTDDDSEDQPEISDVVKTVYQMRFGDEDTAKQVILQDLVGRNYRQTLWDQELAFAKYVRYGNDGIDRDELKLLKTQVFPFEDIEKMVKAGYTMEGIKATMVEAQGTLGGFAVPTTIQSEVIRRLPGMTVVRGNGATVVNLTTGNSTEILEVTGADAKHLYTGNLRGKWGAETQMPTEENLTFGVKTLVADLYTYKVPMSQSLLEDASNVVQILQEEIVSTLAIDEDDAFLVGDGAGKPLGILPDGANAMGLKEVNSGEAADVNADGLLKLKRGVPVQYRSRAIFIANGATWGVIELIKDGTANYMFQQLTESDTILNRRAAESEMMPDVAANAYPILFGDLAGYYIVERTGLTIQRFQDSGTGINKVEFQLRRRVGGRLAKPWMMAVQKIAV